MGGAEKRRLLTNLELEVMQVVWNEAPLTIREVVERLNEGRRKPFAYTTIQTMMMILKRKGVVRSLPGPGRAHRYAPRISRESVTSSMVHDLLERLFDGQAQPLLSQLVEHESVGRDDLAERKHLIEDHLDDEEDEP